MIETQEMLATGQTLPQLVDTSSIQTDMQPEKIALIERVEQPYHAHFLPGIEGHSLNPEGAEHNLDATLVLTDMIRGKMTASKGRDRIHHDIDWFFDKYPATDVRAEGLRKPSAVVRTWLRKLGPHNDLEGAEGDLQSARMWVIETEQEKNNSNIRAGSREFALVADLDLELAGLPDTDEEQRESYLREASAYLEKAKLQHIDQGKLGAACVDQTVLSYARTELLRQKVFGTSLLMASAEPAKYREFEAGFVKENGILQTDLLDSLDVLSEQLDDFDVDTLDELDKEYVKNFGLLFEAVTYSMLLTETLREKSLLKFKVRPGTIREETGTTHISTTPNSEHLGRTFNFNYDLAFDAVNEEDGGGLYTTVYVQNKLNPEQAQHKDAAKMSTKFFGGKKFMFLTPQDTIGLRDSTPEAFTNQLEELEDFISAMQETIKADANVGTEITQPTEPASFSIT